MQHSVYIIYSEVLDRFYTGMTSDSVLRRLEKHNSAAYSNSSFTAKANDWTLKVQLDCIDAAHARRVEIYIKKMKSRKFLQLLIDNESERVSLINKLRSSI